MATRKNPQQLQPPTSRKPSTASSSNNSLALFTGKTYGELGPPPKQPSELRFHPRCGRAGEGTEKLRPAPAAPAGLTLANRGLLEDKGVPADGRRRVEAGEVIMAARPFVFCIATASRGIRCEGCVRKANLKVLAFCLD